MGDGIMGYNGGAVIAMAGKDCVAIASDKRLGVRLHTLAMDFEKVFEMTPRIFMGLTGLATDIQTVHQRLQFRAKLFTLKENRHMTPLIFKNVVANFLYEHRWGPYFVEPVIAGLSKKPEGGYKPYVCSFDLIGCPMEVSDFVVGGTASGQLYGMCETLWRPDMTADELFECISQSLLSGVDRDAASGWGAVVHVIDADKVTTRHLKARMD